MLFRSPNHHDRRMFLFHSLSVERSRPIPHSNGAGGSRLQLSGDGIWTWRAIEKDGSAQGNEGSEQRQRVSDHVHSGLLQSLSTNQNSLWPLFCVLQPCTADLNVQNSRCFCDSYLRDSQINVTRFSFVLAVIARGLELFTAIRGGECSKTALRETMNYLAVPDSEMTLPDKVCFLGKRSRPMNHISMES